MPSTMMPRISSIQRSASRRPVSAKVCLPDQVDPIERADASLPDRELTRERPAKMHDAHSAREGHARRGGPRQALGELVDALLLGRQHDQPERVAAYEHI